MNEELDCKTNKVDICKCNSINETMRLQPKCIITTPSMNLQCVTFFILFVYYTSRTKTIYNQYIIINLAWGSLCKLKLVGHCGQQK